MQFGGFTPTPSSGIERHQNSAREIRLKFEFLLVYVVDPHPGAGHLAVQGHPLGLLSKYHQPLTMEERMANAGHVTVDGVFDTVMVDALQPLSPGNTVWCSAGRRQLAWLIAQDGKVKLSQLWFDGPTMDDAMAAMTA